MRLTQISIQRPVTSFMFFIAIVLLGFVSLRELSVDLLPNISYPRLTVITRCPGVAPGEVENLVTSHIEAAVSAIPSLHRVESVSREGFSYLTIDFIWGTDMDFALLHTREKLDNARYMLPEDAERPVIIPFDPQCTPIMILAVSGERSLLELKGFSEEIIKPRLEQIEGIGSAEITGGVEREIHAEINPRLLALYGLTINQVAQRIDAFNRNLQGGSIRKGRFKLALRIIGEFEEIDEIREIGLKTTEEKGIIRLKDVAQINDSIKERMGITKLNGKESIGILIRKEVDANTAKVTQKARSVLKAIIKENPQIEIVVVSEQAKYIENAISSVWKAIIFGGLLSFLVLFIFLQDLKIPIIIAVVIPVSIIATFNLLHFRNITLNIMSLGGIALGVGMLVDNSIVVFESICRYICQSRDLLEAAYKGTKEVGMAVTTSTLTTISVFLPVIFFRGVTGQLFKDQALTVTFALFSSLLVSLTLLPMLSSRKLKLRREKQDIERKAKKIRLEQKNEKKTILSYFIHPYLTLRLLLYFSFKIVYFVFIFFSSFVLQLLLLLIHYLSVPFWPVVRVVFKGFNLVYKKFTSIYHKFLLWSLENKRKVMIGSLVFLGLTFFIFTQIRRELMPTPESDSFELNCKTPEYYSLEQTEEIISSIERWLKEMGVKIYFSQIGLVSGLETLNPDVSLNSARIYVELRVSSELEKIIEGLRKKLSNLPGLNYSIQREQSPLSQFLAPPRAELGLKIKGDEINKLKEIADGLVLKLKDIEEITDINTSSGEGKPEFLIRIKKEALEKYTTVTPDMIGDFLVNALRGKVATQFKEFKKKINILVSYDKDTRTNIQSLLNEQIPIGHSSIPLREFVSYEIIKAPKEIRRENQERVVLIKANLRERRISQVVPKISKKIDELSLPSNYRIIFGGELKEMNISFRRLIFAFSLAVLLVYMIMAAQFESILQPFFILFTLPMGLTGAVWALFLTGQTLNMISTTGMVILTGIVVNDAILKIDYTNQLRKKGLHLREAVIEASRVRLRPILMTTVTTVFGLFPMTLGLGVGSELQKSLAISVSGGLILATFLTLILIPVVYELIEKMKH